MPNYFECFGLEFMRESEETMGGVFAYVAQNGHPITGYYGSPYLNTPMGDVEIIGRTEIKEDEKALELRGLDTHCGGPCVWRGRLSSMNVNKKDADKMERRVVLNREDGSGMAVVNVVNADVLPCFDEGEEITLQMIGLAVDVHYYADEDQYADAQPAMRNGHKMLLAEGGVFPSGLLRNHDPDSEDFEKNDWMDDHVLIRGTVKDIFWGTFELGDTKENLFLKTTIDTDFGPIQICHTIEQVPEAERTNIKPGSIISGIFVLSGDAAIYEYENGFVRDEEHDLKAFKTMFQNGDPKRVRSLFTEDAVYFKEDSGETFAGRDAIISRLISAQGDNEVKYFAHLATIVEVDPGDQVLPFKVGTRCLVLAAGEENRYETIVFFEHDEKGWVKKMHTSTNGRYHFRIDEKYQKPDPLPDMKGPESIAEAVLARAHFQGVVNDDAEDDDILSGVPKQGEYRNRAVRMIVEASDATGEEKVKMANLFGYLFAKAAETKYAEDHPVGFFRRKVEVALVPSDAFAGKMTINIEAKRAKLEDAMDLGKQFYKDFLHFHPLEAPKSDTYASDLLETLLLVQHLGVLYAAKI